MTPSETPPLRDQVFWLLAYVVLATSEKAPLQSEPPTKNPPSKSHNNAQNSTKLQQQKKQSRSTSRHQTSASLAGFLLRREHNSPLSCSSFLFWRVDCSERYLWLFDGRLLLETCTAVYCYHVVFSDKLVVGKLDLSRGVPVRVTVC